MFEDNGYTILTLDFRNPSLSNHLNILEPIIREYELYFENERLSNEEQDDNKKMEYKGFEHFE